MVVMAVVVVEPVGQSQSCDSDSVYFNLQVLPMLISNCSMSGCHDAASHQEGIVLTSYQTVMNSGIIVPGDPNDGDFVRRRSLKQIRINNAPTTCFSSDKPAIQLLQTWISQGALDLNCDNGCDTLNFTWSATIKPLIQAKCKGCHQGSSPGGGVDLSNYAGVSGAAFDGSCWVL
ncbi:MAG: hypothetical protein IPN36_18645 [Bacteroidetes bacterium]|nr:hypothetical protein [Bacteroidota bacterium]